LDEAEVDSVHAHLASCQTCRSIVESLPDDALASLVRAAAGSPSLNATPADERTWSEVASDPDDVVPAELADHPRYRIGELLGRGGMGRVYKAEHRLMARAVALKVINRRLTDRAGAAERFRREVQAAARLSHANIVTAHDADQAADVHFLVMEFVEGVDLARLVAECGPLPVAQACDYARQAALGFHHAHERGMVHRDVKPHNLMRTPDGQIKILDFGLARFASDSAAVGDFAPPRLAGATAAAGDLTESGVVLGTADYIAPEQADDPRRADARSDVYSLGCTLYFLLTGGAPFIGDALLKKLAAHARSSPPPLADAPPALARVVGRMMAKDPERRYQTAREAAEALVPFLAAPSLDRTGSYVGASHRGGARRPRWDRRRVALWAVAGAAAFVALLLVGAFVHRVVTVPRAPELQTDEIRRLAGHEGTVRAVAYSPDGRYALSASGWPHGDGTLRLWDLETGAEKQRFVGHRGNVECVAFSPKGGQALSGGADHTVRLWDVESGEQIRPFPGHAGEVYAVAFSPVGGLAVSGDETGSVRLWDVETGEQEGRFLGCRDKVLALAFSPDGTRLAGGCADKAVLVWEVATRAQHCRLEGHTGPVRGVAFSPDGGRVLSAANDKTLRLWDVDARRVVQTFEGHTSSVLSAAFLPDRRRALSGGWDHTLRLWDVETGTELHRFTGHADVIWGIAVSPDGRFGLSCSGGRRTSDGWRDGDDWTVRLWRLPEPPAK
jgi:WD40 repeat protein